MLPPDGVLRAAKRWLILLGADSLSKAWLLIRSSGQLMDLSQTQYVSALEWLESLGLVETTVAGTQRSRVLDGMTDDEIAEVMFARCLADWSPAWLVDSDSMVRSPDDLPVDAASLAGTVGLDHERAVVVIRQVHGHVDLERRGLVGALGEAELVNLLSESWRGEVNHASLLDDGLGYDVRLRLDDTIWHLEVKSTTRRGRLVVYLSRHEFETAAVDHSWRLIVVGLDETSKLGAVATVSWPELQSAAPHDHDDSSRWESARFEIAPRFLTAGLPFLIGPGETLDPLTEALSTLEERSSGFAWMPYTALNS